MTPSEKRTAFVTTHWSLVVDAGQGQSPEAAAALEQLCSIYWYPIYSFVRHLGNSPEDAQDLTQGFFLHLLEHHLIEIADPQVGRFRSFLLASLKHYIAHERERARTLKRGGGKLTFSLDALDAEKRLALEPADPITPEKLFERQWAMRQIEQALNQVRADYDASGRANLFDLLKDYVWGDKNSLTLAEIASQLDLTEEAVKKAVQRLRQRFGDCLRTMIAQTVATADQIDDELRHLRAAIALPD